ncbi:hydro-lyase, Fe-S type, tartrate/fumarate subfamily, beta subunit [Anaeromyxobacter dehalogenans 2CP-1]|uniref:Fumarate hydratase class I n=1 Tax=Anaeromyxobacter dehalogenans (strain ATCC BAA-258 / DSM 21875 / 2CP-1) TaxID=455488 RepID=B8J740_ANAD2|nr:fumarate hydratase [Anaeromyxobacter dehalogenans]ACL65230.1 hydro-lyase, Fe-S type, tartrate/fumarate subfamily, beta subunit [Anaeromyxobacter dehalogenans 2CP-1]
MATPAFHYQDPFPVSKDATKYRLLTSEGVSVGTFEGKEILKVEPAALTRLAREAMREVSFFLRPEHNEQVAKILADPEASQNDKGVAIAFLKNAEIAARGELPICQDTGTATIVAKKGQQVWTGVKDEQYLSEGVYLTYTGENLRYSQTSALDMYREVNTGTNLPAQIDVLATEGAEYKFLFVAKGGGSANKTMLFQETKALLTPEKLEKFLVDKMKYLGTAACPPYHIAVVVGGTSAETCLKTVKLASTKYYDGLPTEGNEHGQAFRDVALEQRLLEAANKLGIGAQFGGKYFAHDIRVVRLPRHGASCPVGMAVSCSADRNVKAKINREGLWIEELDHAPGRLIPLELKKGKHEHGVKVDLNKPMKEILAELTKYPVSTPLLLTGTLVVARDIAHAKFKELIDQGKGVPEYLKHHPVYYAGPAKTPKGKPSGSFGPTTAGRMDSYVDLLQSHGASMVMIAKGNRSQQVTDACKKHGGFYLGSIGGPAAVLAEENIKKVECIDFAELGMEAVWKIEVENFPAFILVDDKGNDFFKKLGM